MATSQLAPSVTVTRSPLCVDRLVVSVGGSRPLVIFPGTGAAVFLVGVAVAASFLLPGFDNQRTLANLQFVHLIKFL